MNVGVINKEAKMKPMKINFIALVVAIATVGSISNASAQSEYDDMYFSSRDRVEAEQPLSASTVNKQYRTSSNDEVTDSQATYES